MNTYSALYFFDINMENYMNYISIERTENAVDSSGNSIDTPCVVISSKMHDNGLFFISATESEWDIQFNNQNNGIYEKGSTPFGRVIIDVNDPSSVKINNIQGKYKFVKSEFVEEYVFEKGIRRIKLKDGRQQEIMFENTILDYSKPY